jgi:hypothetical protein
VTARQGGDGLCSDCLGSVWVLILTTAGPTSLAIFTNSLGAMVELTTLSGVASALEFCFSCPRTPWAAKEPATMAAESVASRQTLKRDGACAAVQRAISWFGDLVG